MTHVIAIKQIGALAHDMQVFFHQASNGVARTENPAALSLVAHERGLMTSASYQCHRPE